MSLSTASASISGSSVVPGLPNSTSTPSCFRISRNARFPEMTGKTSSACFWVWAEGGTLFVAHDLIRKPVPTFRDHALFSQQVLVLAGEHEVAVLVMDGRGHHHNAGRALRNEFGDGECGVKRVARVDPFQEFGRLLEEADQPVADHVREQAGADRARGQHLESVRQQPAMPVRAAELDVVMDRMVIAGDDLKGGEMRLRHGP